VGKRPHRPRIGDAPQLWCWRGVPWLGLSGFFKRHVSIVSYRETYLKRLLSNHAAGIAIVCDNFSPRLTEEGLGGVRRRWEEPTDLEG
jgi:hypothetical protein